MWEHKCATLFCEAKNQVEELPVFLNKEAEGGWELFQLEQTELQRNSAGAWVTRIAVFRRKKVAEGEGSGQKQLLTS